MGYKLRFNSYKDLISFIEFVPEFQAWGCKKIYLTSRSNAILTLNTFNNDKNTDEHLPLNAVYNLINPYYTTNYSYGGFILDLKLICPHAYRQGIDPNGYYTNFYIDFYSSDTESYCNLTYEEKTNELVSGPYILWASYIITFYKKWALYYDVEAILEDY